MSKIVVTVMLALSLCIAADGCANDDADARPSDVGGGNVASVGNGSGGGGGGGGSAASSASGGSGGSPIGNGGAAGGTAGMSTAGNGGGGEPNFARVWSEVLVRKSCNSAFCHGMGTGMLSMRNEGDAYMNLVSMPAAGPMCGSSGMLRVTPREPTQSLLLDKISRPMPACGEPMPIGTKFAPHCVANTPKVCNTPEEIALVRDWIAAGALRD